MKVMNQISQLANKYFSVISVLFAIAAFVWHENFVWLGSYITTLLMIVMFGVGMTLKPVDFKLVISKPKPVIIGVLAQFTIMPLLAFGIAVLFKLPPELAAGIILVGCVPGGTSSNVMVYLAKGNTALSIAMTSLSTLLAPILTPTLLYLLAGQWMPVDPIGMFVSIIKVIILPIALGLFIQKLAPQVVEKGGALLPLISVIAIALVCAAVVSGNRDNIAASGLIIFVTVLIHNYSGLFVGYMVGVLLKLDAETRRALSIEVGIQNAGLGVSLAKVHFAASPLTALPGAVAVTLHVINGSILASYWARKSNKKEQAEADEKREMVG
ncbi:bile acid:sodium symporter family protein [Bacillus sp. B15-48]|uniref:bile acid:sodium symporter family protein n=1 Tax=Bacillus sp. B15-48 TaxID=1548601 RepID=UPI00193EF854|nr:bile acid:sodium symporter family protein [Bacillus sp. B15-48]MBM4761220.1 bile acid:sodium symporter family protein [Bacillus sp. B15-48]